MSPKEDLESIAGVEIHSLVHRTDGTVLGAVRVRRQLPAIDAKLQQQGWTIARSADAAPEIAHALALDPVPADVLLLTRETDDELIDELR